MAGNSNKEQQDIFKEVIRTLVSVVEYKSEFFRGHSERVAANCILFSSYLAMPKDFINTLYLAGLLYDIGMVYIPMEIINKRDRLSSEELEIIREHPKIAENILSHLRYLKNALPIIRHHHENYSGDGYPDGLQGDIIPVGARIICMLDSYDAMTSERPHRAALSPEEALDQIHEGAGRTFDPKLVDEFIRFTNKRKEAAQKKEAEPNARNGAIQSGRAAQPGKVENNTVQKAVSDVVLAFQRGIVDVPAFPAVIDKIQSALRSPGKTLEDIAQIIEQDQVVTLRLLSIANSIHYGGGGNIRTAANALSRIGMKEAQSVVSTIALKSMYAANNPDIKALMEKFWSHAIATAHAARAIVKQLNENEGEAIFLLGLTHDVGKVLLLNGLAKSLFAKGEAKPVDMKEVLASIQSVHASFGGALLKKWGFKDEFISAVSNHENPDLSPNASKTNLILYLANMMTRRIGYSMYEDQPDALGSVLSRLGLDEAAVDRLLKEIQETMVKTISAV